MGLKKIELFPQCPLFKQIKTIPTPHAPKYPQFDQNNVKQNKKQIYSLQEKGQDSRLIFFSLTLSLLGKNTVKGTTQVSGHS